MSNQSETRAIIALASELSRAFEHKKRTNGDEYTLLKNGSPEWMKDVCQAGHKTSVGAWNFNAAG